MYIKKPIEKYLQDLAAKMPAPGGGSAAALSSAMAAALVVMACEFTLGNGKYKASEGLIKVILARSKNIQKRLSELMDEDIKAYSLKDLKNSILVPAEICFLSHELIGFASEVVKRGNQRLVTDAALAIFLSEAGFLGALSYVEVNVNALKNKTKTDVRLLKKLKVLRCGVIKRAKKVEGQLGNTSRR